MTTLVGNPVCCSAHSFTKNEFRRSNLYEIWYQFDCFDEKVTRVKLMMNKKNLIGLNILNNLVLKIRKNW